MPYRAGHAGRERVETMMHIYYSMFKHLPLTLFDCCSKCNFDQISTSAQSGGCNWILGTSVVFFFFGG